MSTVVTGSAGFIGRHLCAALESAGSPVTGIDRRVRAEPVESVEITADLLDTDDVVESALRSADVVFHLAGCPGVRDHGPDVAQRRWRDNVLATERVVAAVPLSTPLVVMSSSSVYGGASGRGCRETDGLLPRGGYAHSKVAVERLCARRVAAGGAVAVVRPFTVAGEHQRPDMAFARWIEAARRGDPLTILGSPARTRDVTDARDGARALVLIAERGIRGTINVGTGRAHRLDTLANVVAEVSGARTALDVVPADPDEVLHTRADTAKLRQLTGFVPRTEMRALIARQYASACARSESAAAV